MDGHDLEFEKARLLSLALDFGFDEASSQKCLNRLISLYGTCFFIILVSFVFFFYGNVMEKLLLET